MGGVTISGVSTIYILISVGLTVDYSAHIAHVFTHSTGTSRERAVAALARIGPCVFNAVVSTCLAVMVLSGSKSFIFRTFFKALFLVCFIGGAHGLGLLPALLSVFGGDKAEADFHRQKGENQTNKSLWTDNTKPAAESDTETVEEDTLKAGKINITV